MDAIVAAVASVGGRRGEQQGGLVSNTPVRCVVGNKWDEENWFKLKQGQICGREGGWRRRRATPAGVCRPAEVAGD